MSAVCSRELFTGDVVRKASLLAAGLELKTNLPPFLKYHRRMPKRLEKNIVNYTKEEILIEVLSGDDVGASFLGLHIRHFAFDKKLDFRKSVSHVPPKDTEFLTRADSNY
jgi:hypothetical protein